MASARGLADGTYDVQDLAGRPTLEPVVELETAAGLLLLPRDDQMITRVLADCGVWEMPETRYLHQTLRPGQTFVDVGAHVGYFSVLAARLVGPTGTVIAIEPEERNRDLLHRNLARNRAGVTRVIPFAAGARNASMALALDERNRGAHRLVEPDDPEATAAVRCVRLDDFLPGKVDLIKIDAQGYDHEVIQGLERTLAANPDATVLVEISGDELKRRGIDRAGVLALYEELDFALSFFDANNLPRRASATAIAADLDAFGMRPDFSLLLQRCPTPPFDANSRPIRVPGLTVTENEDGLTVSHRDQERTHRFNPTAALVFELCTGERSVGSIVALVQEVYELPEPPTAMVTECLDRLRREGVIR